MHQSIILFGNLILILVLLLLVIECKEYKECTSSIVDENRELHILTCDTRTGWKEFSALKVWNVTSTAIRNDKNVYMKNICSGKSWRVHGYLTKPLLYLNYLKSLPLKSNTTSGYVHAILMDSDTFWANNSVSALWNRYDCARGDKHIVLSTEMACWVGRYCTQEDLDKWYSKSAETPSYSPFANSGVIMGAISNLKDMLEYVVVNNQSYYITYIKNKFDDQYAIADYAIRVAPQEVALDYHQQLSATFILHAEGSEPEDVWPFRCKTQRGNISLNCPNWTPLLNKLGHFKMDEDTCYVHRQVWKDIPMSVELATLATHPIIWHGNGAGKHLGIGHGYNSYKCLLHKMYNLTIEEYSIKYGYG